MFYNRAVNPLAPSIMSGLSKPYRRAREYVVALRWLELLIARRPGDAQLLSQFGYVQLCIGDLRAAAATFQKVSCTPLQTRVGPVQHSPVASEQQCPHVV